MNAIQEIIRNVPSAVPFAIDLVIRVTLLLAIIQLSAIALRRAMSCGLPPCIGGFRIGFVQARENERSVLLGAQLPAPALHRIVRQSARFEVPTDVFAGISKSKMRAAVVEHCVHVILGDAALGFC